MLTQEQRDKILNSESFSKLLKKPEVSENAGLTMAERRAKSKGIQEENQKSFLSKAGDFFTGNTQKFGKTLGTALSSIDPVTNQMREETLDTTNDMIDTLMEKAKNETDPVKAKKILQSASKLANTENIDIFNNPEYQKTAKQVFGEGLGTLLETLQFSSLGAKGLNTGKLGSELPTVIKPFVSNIKEGAKIGAGYGALFGGGENVSKAMQEDKSIGDIALSGITGGLEGGAVGTVLGGVAGGVSSGIVKGAEKTGEALKGAKKFSEDVIDLGKSKIQGLDKTRETLKKDIDDFIESKRTYIKAETSRQFKNTDIRGTLSDPDVYAGLKIKDGKLNPDDAIKTLNDRIKKAMDAKTEGVKIADETLPNIDKNKLIEEVNNNLPKDIAPEELRKLKIKIEKQLEEVKDSLTTSELDNLRKQFRNSGVNAKGIQKEKGHFEVLENATRDLLFKKLDELPGTNGEFAKISSFVKNNINVIDFLDKTARGHIVTSGKMTKSLSQIGGVLIGGGVGGPFGGVIGGLGAGKIADFLANKTLGNSLKKEILNKITNGTPETIKEVEKLLEKIPKNKLLSAPEQKLLEQGIIRLPEKTQSFIDKSKTFLKELKDNEAGFAKLPGKSNADDMTTSILKSKKEGKSKYNVTVNMQDKDDINYLRRILSDDQINDIKNGKMVDWKGRSYQDLAKVNIISEKPKTIAEQLSGKIENVKLKSDTFYHGTSNENAKNIMSSGFKKGSELPKNTFRGGGYDRIQNSISLAETPKEASIFSELTKNGKIIEVKLKPNSKVVSIKGIEDANDLEDYIDYLKKQNIDAVYIGGGEKELVIINQKAIKPTKSQLKAEWDKVKN